MTVIGFVLIFSYDNYEQPVSSLCAARMIKATSCLEFSDSFENCIMIDLYACILH